MTSAFFERHRLPIGLQVFTLAEDAASDLDATFARIAEIGYRDLELPNLFGRTTEEVAAAARGAGLTISSLHIAAGTDGLSGLSLTSPAAQLADDLGTLAAQRLVLPVPLFPENFRAAPGKDVKAEVARAFAAAGEDPWLRTAAFLNERAAALRAFGIRVGYHNHNLEFAPIGETSGWKILLRECDPALVDLEIDVGWVAAAGMDPSEFIQAHRDRCTQLHVKDIATVDRANHDLILDSAEVGSGVLEWTQILPAAYAAGVRHFYVEQEPPFAIPPMEAARQSFVYLAQLIA